MTVPHHTSSDIHGVLQSSFNLSQGSLPPAEGGSRDFEPFAPLWGLVTPTSTSSHLVTSSWHPMHLNTAIATSEFSAQQMREIYELAQEGQWLGAKFTKDFTELSSQEALFHIMVQVSSYENVADGHPDHYTTYYAIMCSEGDDDDECERSIKGLHKKASKAWLDTNSTLFQHILEFETELVDLIMEANNLLQAQ